MRNETFVTIVFVKCHVCDGREVAVVSDAMLQSVETVICWLRAAGYPFVNRPCNFSKQAKRYRDQKQRS